MDTSTKTLDEALDAFRQPPRPLPCYPIVLMPGGAEWPTPLIHDLPSDNYEDPQHYE